MDSITFYPGALSSQTMIRRLAVYTDVGTLISGSKTLPGSRYCPGPQNSIRGASKGLAWQAPAVRFIQVGLSPTPQGFIQWVARGLNPPVLYPEWSSSPLMVNLLNVHDAASPILSPSRAILSLIINGVVLFSRSCRFSKGKSRSMWR